MPDVEVLGLDDVTATTSRSRTEPTFEGNALLKARAGVAATGLPSLADDSGLCVDALNGMPGVLSARWAGPDAERSDARNNELLLAQLADVPDERRGAHFACAVAFVLPRRRPSASSTGGWTAGSSASSGGAAASATTCVFVADEHDAEGLTTAELPPGRRTDLPPRPGAARDGAVRRRRPRSGD